MTNISSTSLFARPRYLRAIPSLVLLTTAMAWGMAPDTDSDAEGAQKKARVTLSQQVMASQDSALESTTMLRRRG